MKTINEKELLRVMFQYFNNSSETGAIVLPINHTGNIRWYVTKITNAFLEFLGDQPLLKEISRRKNIRWEDLEKRAKEITGIGALLKFIPGDLSSEDILVNNYNIQPYPVENIDKLPEMMVELFHDGVGKVWYSGPLHLNNKLEEYQCCYYQISEEELKKDIEKFREGKNEYFTTFDELDYSLPPIK